MRGLEGVGLPGEPGRGDLDARFQLAARLPAVESELLSGIQHSPCMTELSVVLEPKASRLPAPSTPDPANSAARATRPLKWKMLDGSSPAPAWLWLPFLSSHGIGYGSSLPPTGARTTPPRWAVPAVAHPVSAGAPIEAATSAAPRSRSRRPAALTHFCF